MKRRNPIVTTCLAAFLCLGGLAALSCGRDPQHPASAEVAAATSSVDPAAAAQTQAPQAAIEDRLPNARQHFQHVKDLLLKNYYDDKITEDDLYRAALQGMLTYLEPRMQAWNKLIPPDELTQLRMELAGELVGIGVVIKFDEPSGLADIIGTLPGSAAERAGVKEGDKVLSVNGKSYRGKTLRDVVRDIRGKAGEAVALTLLRGDQLVHLSVRRERLAFDSVKHMLLPGGVGVLEVGSFNNNTERAAREVLGEFKQKGVTGLIVDLRDNQGGGFDQAVATAGLLLPRGQTIVRMVRRGGRQESMTAQGEPVLSGVPVVVLVNGKTSSGGEFVTAALREGLKAQVVGEKTFGKWSVQTIEELGDRYAVKYTVSLFQSPSGQSYEGKGLLPDVQVDMNEKQAQQAERVRDPEQRLQLDTQLRTAARLLTR